MLKTWKLKSVCGPSPFPEITVQAIQLTKQNADEVAVRCGGERGRGARVSVPSECVKGDPNAHPPEKHPRELKRVACNVPANETDYVVLYDDVWYVASAEAFVAAYELA